MVKFSWDESPTKIRRRMRRRRRRRRLAATTRGYFWIPCPRCKTEFGGNEMMGRFMIVIEQDSSHTTSKGICPACEVEMGRMGRQLCSRSGHTPQEGWTGLMRGNLVTVRFGGVPDVVYCTTCGVDLPREQHDVGA
jgi:hypothetical protein